MDDAISSVLHYDLNFISESATTIGTANEGLFGDIFHTTDDTLLSTPNVGVQIDAFFPFDNNVYPVIVESIIDNNHHIYYADGDSENVILDNETWRLPMSISSISVFLGNKSAKN